MDSESGHSSAELLQMIFQFFADELEFYSVTGVVKSLNASKKQCVVTPDNGDPDIQFVKYAVNANSNNGIIIKPKVGSQVTVSFLGNNNGVITKIQEFETFTFDNGTNTLPVAESVLDRLNKIETALDNIFNAINGAAVMSGDGGAAFKTNILAALAVASGQVTPHTQLTDINYDKVKLP